MIIDVLEYFQEEFLKNMSTEQYLPQIFKGIIETNNLINIIRTEIKKNDEKEIIKIQLNKIINLLEKEIKDEKSYIIDFNQLINKSKEHVRINLSTLKATKVESSAKYIPHLFTERKQVTNEYREYLKYWNKLQKEYDKNKGHSGSKKQFENMKKYYCVTFVGEAGIGKTTHLCDIAENKSKDFPTLFFNGFGIRKNFEDMLKDEINQILNTDKDFINLIQLLNKILIENKSQLLIFIDAINESPNYKELKFDISDIFRKFEKLEITRIFFCISCRDMDWKFFIEENPHFTPNIFNLSNIEKHVNYQIKRITKEIKEKYSKMREQISEIEYKQKMEKEIEAKIKKIKRNIYSFFIWNYDPNTLQHSYGFMIEPFRGVELEKIWNIYRKIYELNSKPFHSLSQGVKEVIQNPLMLRFLSEGFKSSPDPIPDDIKRIEIFNRYWERKFNEIGRMGLRVGKDNLKQESINFIFSLSRMMRNNKTGAIRESEVELYTGISSKGFYSPFFRVLSEYIIIYTRLDSTLGTSVVSFTYEAFFEFVIAKDIYTLWIGKDSNFILRDFENLIQESKFRNVKGAIQYLILFLEHDKNMIYKKLLLKYILDKSDADFVYDIILRLKYIDSEIIRCIKEIIKKRPDKSHIVNNLLIIAPKIHYVFIEGVFDELETWTKEDSFSIIEYFPIILTTFYYLNNGRTLKIMDIIMSKDHLLKTRLKMFESFKQFQFDNNYTFKILNKFLNDDSRRLRTKAKSYIKSMELTNPKDIKYLINIDDLSLIKPIDFKIEILKESHLSPRNRYRLIEDLFFLPLTNKQLHEIVRFLNDKIDNRRQKIIWEKLFESDPTDAQAQRMIIEGLCFSNLTKRAKQKLSGKGKLD